jgi:hypothetical protein
LYEALQDTWGLATALRVGSPGLGDRAL